MVRSRAIAILALSLALASRSFGDDGGVRSRESFNAGWRFARFGPMADGTSRPEPGAERWSVGVSASSEEVSKGNVAANAFDGDRETRWCASSGAANEWLVLDLGRDQKIDKIALEWEFPELTYGSVAETSLDGKQWTPLRRARRASSVSGSLRFPRGSGQVSARSTSPIRKGRRSRTRECPAARHQQQTAHR